MHVTAITHRADPIYPTTIVGKPPQEDYWMGKATERLFLPLMQLFMGEIADVNMPAEGIFHNLVIVSMKKRFPGHPQKIMYGLWGLGLMMLAKAILVVDEDADVHDTAGIIERVLTHVDWRRDVTIVDGPVDQLDHSAILDSYGGKIGIDATRKPDRAAFLAPAPLADDALASILGPNWTSPRRGWVIFAADKAQRSARETFEALWQVAPLTSLIALDPHVDLHNLSDVAWRTLGNVDWRRDIVIHGGPVDHFAGDGGPRGQIGIDATAKGPADGHPRGWPHEIEMSAEIKALVDRKWGEYGIG
jgi:4-hydroxy-3-polyprenylbenzoate decarboxylase